MQPVRTAASHHPPELQTFPSEATRGSCVCRLHKIPADELALCLEYIVRVTRQYVVHELPLARAFSSALPRSPLEMESYHSLQASHTSTEDFLLNYRCSLIEPGPVTTSFTQNAKFLREGIDISSADEKTQQLLKAALKEMYNNVQTQSQTPEEVASIIKSVILSANPHLRYQTNSKYGPGEIQAKLSDLTGDKAVQLMERRFFPDVQK